MSDLERFDYADGAKALTGWLARPSGSPRGAVVVFPTIANPKPPTERRALMLAEAGFLVLLADFYGEPCESFEAAGPLAQALKADWSAYRRRCLAPVTALKCHPEAAGLKVAATGYCMGGQAALEVARSGADLVAVASFHGLLQTEQPSSGPIPARLLVCHGDADPMVPRDAVIEFWREMDAAGANWHFHAYSGVKHGFTDPGSDARGLPAIAYDQSADRQSWAALMSLFDEVFA